MTERRPGQQDKVTALRMSVVEARSLRRNGFFQLPAGIVVAVDIGARGLQGRVNLGLWTVTKDLRVFARESNPNRSAILFEPETPELAQAQRELFRDGRGADYDTIIAPQKKALFRQFVTSDPELLGCLTRKGIDPQTITHAMLEVLLSEPIHMRDFDALLDE